MGPIPVAALSRACTWRATCSTLLTDVVDLGKVDRLLVIGAGKASLRIAAALEEILGDRISDGIVVVKRGESGRLRRIEVREAGHPLPDQDSIEGARRMLELAQSAGERDLVLLAITGGASALATLPPDSVGLDDVRSLTDELLKCGATIRDINTVRRHLCLIKGGRLVQCGATCRGDHVHARLRRPTACRGRTCVFLIPRRVADAIAVLDRYGLCGRRPRADTRVPCCAAASSRNWTQSRVSRGCGRRS